MNIIYFLEGTFNSGGIERIVINKANWLAEHGHNVTIITSDQNGRPDYFPLKGVKRIDMDLMYRSNSSNSIKRYFQRRKSLKKEEQLINQYIRELKPDVMISTFSYEKNILPHLKDGSKKIVEIHFSRWFRLQRNRKGIGRIIDRFLTWQDIQSVNKYDKFICLTEEDKQHWKGLKNIEVISNFIDPISRSPASLENKICIAVGRLVYQKGYDRMIEAWKLVHAKYPDWKLNIYGNGPLQTELIKMIEQKHLEDVINIYSPVKNIDEKYRESSMLIMTSHYEGLPMVMLEAMACGLPVVTFDYKCGPKDIIKDGVNGLLIKEGNIEGLADAICKVIGSKELREKMGENSYNLAKNYNREIIMAKWEHILTNV
ncbi:MAG: glycosyltransferase family 4 protein [Muribaculaceae bacterium]|nr:glycosyltransferase family 4 protein [Muribaculaceae bacterium]